MGYPILISVTLQIGLYAVDYLPLLLLLPIRLAVQQERRPLRFAYFLTRLLNEVGPLQLLLLETVHYLILLTIMRK